MTSKTVSINRAPVLTLWAAVVAQRLGFDEDEALSLGKAVAGLNAQAKGRGLGIFGSYLLQLHRENRRFPGRKILPWSAAILLLIAAALYIAITRFGYHLAPHVPFLTR